MRKKPLVELPAPAAKQPEKYPPPPGRSWETGEVPSSIPEQDLVAATPDPEVPVKTKAAQSKGRSKAKAKNVKATTPVASTSYRKTRSRSRSRNPAKKRRVESDTDLSSDSADYLPKAVKEEEEETEPADEDYMEMDDDEEHAESSSRKRKRGKAKARANPKRTTKTASRMPTRASKRSGNTPTTRESNRLRTHSSGVGTRVFAYWKQDGHYYSGTVHSHVSGTKYVVKFDDATDDEVDILRMRLNELRVGDHIILISSKQAATVVDVDRLRSEGVVGAEYHDGEEFVQTDVRHSGIRIAVRAITSQWKDRGLTNAAIDTTLKPKPLKPTPSPSKVSILSSTSNRGSRSKALSKIGIAVTLSPGHENWEAEKQRLVSSINANGGMVIDDWFAVIRMDGKFSNDGKRWTINSTEVKWAGKGNLQQIFLVADDASQKPKYLLALALGIPCLSVNWLTDQVNEASNSVNIVVTNLHLYFY